MDLNAIVAAGTSLKSAADLAKAFVDVKTAVEVQAKVFELQRVILSAQQDTFAAQQTQSALLAEKGRLEEKIASLETWSREKERYQLSEVGRGTLAYLLKPDAQGSDPPHMACANCFKHGRVSILQRDPTTVGGSAAFTCPDCTRQITARPLKADDPSPSPTLRVNLAGSGSGGPKSWMNK